VTIRHKLSNVMLEVAEHVSAHPELYYRTSGSVSYDGPSSSLVVSGSADFLTYLNACPVIKWRRYAEVSRVWLHLETSAVGSLLRVVGVPSGETYDEQCLSTRALDPSEGTSVAAGVAYDIELPVAGMDLVAFRLSSDAEPVSLISAYYYVQVEEGDVNDVRLALSTTTFKKENYIVPNIGLVREGLSCEDDPVAGHFHMFVVDNGRTLDADALSDDLVTVIPNENVGGAGGFARGMIAALESDEGFTHVLLMDDDVRIFPESLKRTYNLLALARGRYRTAFINGAMLSLDDPTRQFEDVSYVDKTAVYRRIKEDLYVDDLADVIKNERTDVEVDHAYGAWWFSCIPLTVIRENGLPLPLFVRCDDVEFGMRNKPTYMTMGGICVWHESFEGRFRASVDCYQYVRNFLVMIAMDDCASEDYFLMRLKRSIRINLRDLDYTAAELLLDGFADYLKGPNFLAAADGAALMKANGARNEKIVPVSEMDPEILASAGVTEEVTGNPSMEYHAPYVMRFLRGLPYDKHYLPDFALSEQPRWVVKNGTATLAGSSTAAKTLVFLDPTRTKGAIRHMDKDRYRAIRHREARLLHEYDGKRESVRREYHDAKGWLTSMEFWKRYLGM
jgi:GT2 family glycosyltransferase